MIKKPGKRNVEKIRTSISFDRNLLRALKILAKDHGLSTSDYCEQVLRRHAKRKGWLRFRVIGE